MHQNKIETELQQIKEKFEIEKVEICGNGTQKNKLRLQFMLKNYY